MLISRRDKGRKVKQEAWLLLLAGWTAVALPVDVQASTTAPAELPDAPVSAPQANFSQDWPTPAVAPIAWGAGANDGFRTLMIETHNRLRARFGIAPLTWDAQLASDAWQWAGELARRDRMEHSSFQERKGQGENLATGITRYHDMELLVNLWVDEEPQVKAGIFPDVSRTGNVRDVGHFTQMVWKRTQKVGCAQQGNGTNSFLVCRYYPSGNALGSEFNYRGGLRTALNSERP